MFHIVENDERQRSVWPDYRKHALPTGWRFVGFSGSREHCLERIAAGETATAVATPVPSAHAPRSTPAAPVARDRAAVQARAVAVPFPKAQAPMRLFVFPHAGSGASSYHFLARACKEDAFEIRLIQYPGREMRIRETPCSEMASMLASLDEDLRESLVEQPFAFFGHSMGALVAFELLLVSLERRLGRTAEEREDLLPTGALEPEGD